MWCGRLTTGCTAGPTSRRSHSLSSGRLRQCSLDATPNQEMALAQLGAGCMPSHLCVHYGTFPSSLHFPCSSLALRCGLSASRWWARRSTTAIRPGIYKYTVSSSWA